MRCCLVLGFKLPKFCAIMLAFRDILHVCLFSGGHVMLVYQLWYEPAIYSFHLKTDTHLACYSYLGFNLIIVTTFGILHRCCQVLTAIRH